MSQHNRSTDTDVITCTEDVRVLVQTYIFTLRSSLHLTTLEHAEDDEYIPSCGSLFVCLIYCFFVSHSHLLFFIYPSFIISFQILAFFHWSLHFLIHFVFVTASCITACFYDSCAILPLWVCLLPSSLPFIPQYIPFYICFPRLDPSSYINFPIFVLFSPLINSLSFFLNTFPFSCSVLNVPPSHFFRYLPYSLVLLFFLLTTIFSAFFCTSLITFHLPPISMSSSIF